MPKPELPRAFGGEFACWLSLSVRFKIMASLASRVTCKVLAVDNQTVVIAVPVYRMPTPAEEISLRHLQRHLGRYEIRLVAPRSLEIDHTRLRELPIERFHDHFFAGIAGYNRLMLSKTFYRRFQPYTYLLIYQLDCLVFRDDLLHWCSQGFDYIGAPWFKDFAEDAAKGLWMAGNGGLSLRRIPKFLEVFESRKLFYAPEVRTQQTTWFNNQPHLRELFCRAKKELHRLGFRNNVRFAMQTNANEDFFWSAHAPRFVDNFVVAPAEIALGFAFECAPAWCYERNGRKLPFGCHAWERRDPDFWSPFLLKT